ncbi:unnamed protein product [Brassica rapa]|uniref:Uncharacterized protein n=1 Tax=Brassica campestris TaxID=3711 RepID=A0A3P6CRN4_BRACM|nr:unnamed protein product [Brassica rapa]VDD10189.1 unnamed protein product [Brassica rapa]
MCPHRSVFLRIHKTTPLKITAYRLCFRTDLSLLPHTPIPLPSASSPRQSQNAHIVDTQHHLHPSENC